MSSARRASFSRATAVAAFTAAVLAGAIAVPSAALANWWPTPTRGAISGWFWQDTNENGIQDPDERHGLNNVTLTAYRHAPSAPNGPVIDTWVTRTDGAGNYKFTDLPAGIYTIKTNPFHPDKQWFSSPDQGYDDTVDSDFIPENLPSTEAKDFLGTVEGLPVPGGPTAGPSGGMQCSRACP